MMLLAVIVPLLALPLPSVLALRLVVLRLAPEDGAVKVTLPPDPTGSLALLAVSCTTSGLAKLVLMCVLWLLPLLMASVKPCDSNAPMSQALGRATPRWSRPLTGLALQVVLSPASIALLPGSSANVC